MFGIDIFDNFKKENIQEAIKEGKINSNHRRYLLMFLYKGSDAKSRDFLIKYGGKLNDILDGMHMFTIYDEEIVRSWGNTTELELLLKQFSQFKDEDAFKRFKNIENIGESFEVKPDEYPVLIVYNVVNNKYAKKTITVDSYVTYKFMRDLILDIKENGNDSSENGFKRIRKMLSSDVFVDRSGLEERFMEEENFMDLYNEFKTRIYGSITRIQKHLDMTKTTYDSRFLSDNFDRIFKRDQIIVMAIDFGLNEKDCNRLLRSYGYYILSNTHRDNIIANGLNNHLTFEEIEDELFDNEEDEFDIYKRRERCRIEE